MAGIYVKDRTGGGATVVPNRFIDQFLPEASGEFVKVYLFLLRHASREGELSLSRMAEGLCFQLVQERSVTVAFSWRISAFRKDGDDVPARLGLS